MKISGNSGSLIERIGTTQSGKQLLLGRLKNKKGVEIEVLNLGATILSIMVPDKMGDMENVVLRYQTLTDYETNPGYVGCVVGRYGNRIEGARFTLDGTEYLLETNNGPNSLHGGENMPFHRQVWDMVAENGRLILSHFNPSMVDGFPGNIEAKITYSLNEDDQLRIDYEAISDEKTVLNITNHSYFALGGKKGDPMEHELLIAADRYLPVDGNMIPLKESAEVINTPFDFTKPMKIGLRIEMDHPQLKLAHGYDHTYILNHYDGSLQLVAELYDAQSGRCMKTYTTEPGVQLYTANFLDIVGEGGKRCTSWSGVCLETQHFPNSPNRPDFPSTILDPGATFRSTTVYEFQVQG